MTSAELQAKFTDFINQHKGGKVKTATAYNGKDSGPYQCVEEPKAFLEFVGLKSGAYGNAIKWWYSTAAYLLAVCDKVSGTTVQAADIVVLESNKTPIVKGSGEGHIGQATGNQTATEFEIFEQNGSTGNGSGTGNDALRTRMVPKARIAGILRIKTTSSPALSGTKNWIPAGAVGMDVILSRSVDSWRFYHIGTRNVITRLNPKKNGGRYLVEGIDTAIPNRVIITSPTWGRGSLPVDQDATFAKAI